MGNFIGFTLSALIHLALLALIWQNSFEVKEKSLPLKLDMFITVPVEPLPVLAIYNNDLAPKFDKISIPAPKLIALKKIPKKKFKKLTYKPNQPIKLKIPKQVNVTQSIKSKPKLVNVTQSIKSKPKLVNVTQSIKSKPKLVNIIQPVKAKIAKLVTVSQPSKPTKRVSTPQKIIPPVNKPVKATNDTLLETAYKRKLQKAINQHKQYPRMAKRRGIEGKVKVSFVILANGKINKIKIVHGSGYSILDTAAKKTIQSISGLLPFPKTIKRNQWQFNLPIVYELN